MTSRARDLAYIAALSLGLAACPPEKPVRAPENFGPPTAEENQESPEPKAAPPPKEDAPEVSRSRGPKGGVIVLWPRVWPRDDDDAATRAIAHQVQQRLETLSKRVAGNRSVELRPDPERVCPRDGCVATSVGAVIVLRDKACAVAAYVAGPGTSPGRLLPWAGKTKFAQETIPFREPPEEQVKVEDYVSCDKLLAGNEDREAAIAKYIAGLLPGG